MFMKSKFNHTHKKSALYLEKQKSWKIGAKRALCSSKMYPVQWCWVRSERMVQTGSRKETFAESFITVT